MTRSMTRRSFAGLAVGIPGLAALYACTPGDPPPDESPPANAAITERQTGGGEEADEESALAEVTEQQVSMVDFAFEPANFAIPADTDVPITVINNGAANHYWLVEEYPDFATPEVQGGDTAPNVVTVNLPAGEYNVICPVPGHVALGMVGTLTVGGAAAVSGAEDNASQAEGTPEAAGTPEGGATPEGEATPVATSGDGAAAGGTSFQVSMVDLAFEPADLTIPADTDVTVTVVNNGLLNHYWAFEDFPEIASPEVQGGDTTPHDVIVNLPAGEYRVICPVPGHAAAMNGIITVQ